ncbi:MAG: trypsin-like peptidase domain-containing protein [Ruminococcaceae bacterium]|nr:trypsin-like peptidase domain-containing protein [Oscillospiraceae bacterium]
MKYKTYIRVISLILAVLSICLCFWSCSKPFTDTEEDSRVSDTAKVTVENYSNTELTFEEMYKKIEPSIVKVLCYDYDGKKLLSQGSGFFIDKNGTFITNAHVVKDCYCVKVQTYFGTVYDVNLMYKYNDTTSDYAICRIKTEYSSIPIEFVQSVEKGDKVYAFGYPNGSYTVAVAEGKIITTDAVKDNVHYYVNSAKIDHGSSGGALINSKGQAIGITTGASSESDYVALRYVDFKDDIKSEFSGGKDPATYFHTVRSYTFAQPTMFLYFDATIVNVNADSDTEIQYEVNVKLKEEYHDAKILLDSHDGTTITIEIATTYDYYEILEDGTSHQTQVKECTAYFNFNSLEELKKGKNVFVTSAVPDSLPQNYYGMKINYDSTFWAIQKGMLTIYN